MRVQLLGLANELEGDSGAGQKPQQDSDTHTPWRNGPPAVSRGAGVVADRGPYEQDRWDGAQEPGLLKPRGWLTVLRHSRRIIAYAQHDELQQIHHAAGTNECKKGIWK